MNSTPTTGLSSAEVARRLRKGGGNELPMDGERTFIRLVFEVLKEPMFLLLVACGALYWVLGDRQEAYILLGFVFFIMGITIAQDWKTERALKSLRDLTSPRAVVVRDGVQQRIAGRDVVEGDLLILSEGDRIAADARLVSASHLAVDESLLTGESVPVRKSPRSGENLSSRPGGDDQPFVFASTLVVQGQGVAEVTATGIRTEVGRIGLALKSLVPESTLLQKETHQLVRRITVVALALCAAVIFIYGLTRENWMGGLLAGLTLAMAILPNEFPMVLVIFLSMGAWRLSKKRVLTRRMAAVEMLGAATVLCTDKTGTLTQNRMTLETLYADGRVLSVSEMKGENAPFRNLLVTATLACQPNPVDPMEQAVGKLLAAITEGPPPWAGWTRVHEYPLSRGLLAMSNLWKSEEKSLAQATAKGAPEAVFDLCHLPEDKRGRLGQVVEQLSTQGLRVLGVARATPSFDVRPTNQHDFDFEFVGLLGFVDPIRPGVPAAVADAQRAGIRVVMITGDHPGTASSVARQVGILNADKTLTGPELERLSDEQVQDVVERINVFARVVPEQKLRLVQALKKNGEVTVMTGDGVNDAPALKAAHIGIAMGQRGTDVAREAADLVLLDDDFSSLVAGVRIGRRVFDNLRKGMAYILAVHVPIAGMTLFPVALKWPLILLPVHIAFLHLIIDPAGSVVFEAEPEESGVMDRPPRRPTEPLFGRALWIASLSQGGAVMGVVLTLFGVVFQRGHVEANARAITFTALIVANLGLIFSNRSWSRTSLSTLGSRNLALWLVTLGSVVFLGLVLQIPFLRTMFHFAPLHANDIVLCLVAGGASVAWFEVAKWVKGRWSVP